MLRRLARPANTPCPVLVPGIRQELGKLLRCEQVELHATMNQRSSRTSGPGLAFGDESGFLEPMRRTFHIFFHSPCFDGIVSAVLLSEFVEHALGYRRVTLHAVNYGIRQDWPRKRLPQHSGVVDFLYHPGAEIWIDHHSSTFERESARRRFEREHRQSHIYDPASPSCAALVSKYLEANYSFSTKRFRSLVQWADRIDSAAYRRVSEPIRGRAAALQINRSLAGKSDPKYCAWLVQQLRTKPLTVVANDPKVQTRVKAVDRHMEAGLRAFKKGAKLEDGNIVVFQVEADGGSVNRYAPYYFFPKARYSVGIVRHGPDVKLTAMRNPWRTFPSVPIGALLARFGGGGHPRVGSVFFRGHKSAAASGVLRQVVGALKTPS